MGTIVLNHLARGSSGLPIANCLKHGNLVPPAPVSVPGKLTVVWKCPICEAKAEAGKSKGCKKD